MKTKHKRIASTTNPTLNNSVNSNIDQSMMTCNELRDSNTKNKFEQELIEHENQRLYRKIYDIENTLQCSFLGMNNLPITNKSKLKQAGIDTKEGANAKSILESDRLRFSKGGHSSKLTVLKHKKIDLEN